MAGSRWLPTTPTTLPTPPQGIIPYEPDTGPEPLDTGMEPIEPRPSCPPEDTGIARRLIGNPLVLLDERWGYVAGESLGGSILSLGDPTGDGLPDLVAVDGGSYEDSPHEDPRS